MPSRFLNSDGSLEVRGHVEHDFDRVLLNAIDENMHFAIISFPGFPESETFFVADLDFMQAVDADDIPDNTPIGDGQYAGDKSGFSSKYSTFFIYGRMRELLKGNINPQAVTTWEFVRNSLRTIVQYQAGRLGTKYFAVRSERI